MCQFSINVNLLHRQEVVTTLEKKKIPSILLYEVIHDPGWIMEAA